MYYWLSLVLNLRAIIHVNSIHKMADKQKLCPGVYSLRLLKHVIDRTCQFSLQFSIHFKQMDKQLQTSKTFTYLVLDVIAITELSYHNCNLTAEDHTPTIALNLIYTQTQYLILGRCKTYTLKNKILYQQQARTT